MKTLYPSLILTLLSFLIQADETLSVNFTNGAGPNEITEETGMVPDPVWENLLQKAQGSATIPGKATVKWEVYEYNSSKSPIYGIPTGYPDRLFRSQLRTNSFEEGALTITVENLSEDLQKKGVDVILYWQGSKKQKEQLHVQPFTVNGKEKWMVSHGENAISGEFVTGELTDQTSALQTSKSINTLVFRNVKTFPIVIQTRRDPGAGGKGAASGGGLSGFQIVPAGTAPQMEKQ